MTENRFVLDTNAVIFLTTQGNAISADLQDAFDNADLFVSVITEIELFAKLSLPQDEAETLRAFLADWVTVTDLGGAVKEETISLRRSTKLKLPDCIIAATSIVLDATLLTNDEHFFGLSLPNFRAQKIQ